MPYEIEDETKNLRPFNPNVYIYFNQNDSLDFGTQNAIYSIFCLFRFSFSRRNFFSRFIFFRIFPYEFIVYGRFQFECHMIHEIHQLYLNIIDGLKHTLFFFIKIVGLAITSNLLIISSWIHSKTTFNVTKPLKIHQYRFGRYCTDFHIFIFIKNQESLKMNWNFCHSMTYFIVSVELFTFFNFM